MRGLSDIVAINNAAKAGDSAETATFRAKAQAKLEALSKKETAELTKLRAEENDAWWTWIKNPGNPELTKRKQDTKTALQQAIKNGVVVE